MGKPRPSRSFVLTDGGDVQVRWTHLEQDSGGLFHQRNARGHDDGHHDQRQAGVHVTLPVTGGVRGQGPDVKEHRGHDHHHRAQSIVQHVE